MNRTLPSIAPALFVLLSGPTDAHRLDEYLQATVISLKRDRVAASLRLTPGVAVSASVLAAVDANADGAITHGEQRAYAKQVLHDLSLTVDGKVLALQLATVEFPSTADIEAGLGEIHIEFNAGVPRGPTNRSLVFENHHHSEIAAYLVNCSVPEDQQIRVVAQHRNEQQSFYRLDYLQSADIKK
jgi:hypothetical protein